MIGESNFVKDDGSLALNNLANFVKRSTGKINIQMKGKTALALDFEKDKLLLDIIDPTGLAEPNKTITMLDYLER